MAWLDRYFVGYVVVQQDGNAVAKEPALNFVSGVTVVDDPVNLRTLLTINAHATYAASSASNWAGSSPPVYVDAALDRIAAALTALGHSP